MSIRFRKSVKLAPGVKLNIGKKSAGISLGGKYGGVSFNSKTGAKGRVSAPGTGLSYSTSLSSDKKKISQNEPSNVVFQENNYLVQNDTSSEKNKIVALVLAIFLGYLGIHRFYAGKVGTGVIWLLTGGLFVFGWIYDIVKIASGTFTDGAGCVIRK